MIQIAALFGKGARNVALILISIFTVLQVYTSALMILQFVTIAVSYVISNSILRDDNKEFKARHDNITLGRKFGELPKAEFASTQFYGLSDKNPILMSSIPSSYRFLNKIVEDKPSLTFVRNGSLTNSNFQNPIDRYTFSKDGKFLVNLYIYPYYNSNVEIVPDILKQI